MTDAATDQLIERGRDAFARKAYAEALDAFDGVVEKHPTFADVQNLRGLCLCFLGRDEDALEAFTTATDTNPGYVEAHLNRAITLTELNRYEEAAESFRLASEADDEKTEGRMPSLLAARLANAHGDLGDVYAEAHMHAEALEQYVRAVDLRPQFLDIRNKLVRALIDLGRLDEAIVGAQQVLRRNPTYVAARFNLALALFRRGDRDEARAEWETCLVRQPENAQVRGFLRILEEGGA